MYSIISYIMSSLEEILDPIRMENWERRAIEMYYQQTDPFTELDPKTIGRPIYAEKGTIKGIPIKEYRKMYYEAHKKNISKANKEKKQLNALGKTTLVYLKQKYSFASIRQVIPRSVPWLSKKYKELQEQNYINTQEYTDHLIYLNSGADLIGPLDLSRCCFSKLEDRINILKANPKAEQPQL